MLDLDRAGERPGSDVIEPAFSGVEIVCGNVKRGHGCDQRERWVGSGLLVAGKQFRRVHGYKQIPILLKEREAAAGNPIQDRGCQGPEGLVKWFTRGSLFSTEFRAFPQRGSKHFDAGPGRECPVAMRFS